MHLKKFINLSKKSPYLFLGMPTKKSQTNTNRYAGKIPLVNAKNHLNIPTNDGSNQCTHPDILYFPKGWNGYKYWMSMTPLPYGDAKEENPSIIVSNNGICWEAPGRSINPLTVYPGYPSHNCDPDMIYNPNDKKLWIYFLECDNTSSQCVYVLKSEDGLNWSQKECVIHLNQKYSVVSPSIVYKKGIFYMFSINTGDIGFTCQNNIVELRTSTDGMKWSSPVALTNFVQPGYQIWHMDVKYIKSKAEYWCIYAAYPTGANGDCCELFYAKSKNGIDWTIYNTPIISAGESGNWDSNCIYRSTFLFDDKKNLLRVWYGAQKESDGLLDWHIGYTRCNYNDFKQFLHTH